VRVRYASSSDLLRFHGLRQRDQVLRKDANETCTWIVDIGYNEEHP
jgi:hypothetical protein